MKNGKIIPEEEISEKFSRSGGKGGQNVNKLSTKAEARWNIESSTTFTPEKKEKIKQVLEKKINKEGELIIVSQKERSQIQNRKQAIKQLNYLVKSALILKNKRKSTKPTKASKERRLAVKRRLREKKMWRKKPAQGWSA